MQIATKPALEFAELTAEKRELDARLKDINERLAKIEQAAMSCLIDNNLPNLTVTLGHKGDYRLYLSELVTAKPKDGDREAVIAALKRARLGHYVKPNYNANALNAYVRERLLQAGKLPPTLQKVLEVKTFTKLRCAKAQRTEGKARQIKKRQNAANGDIPL